MSRSSTSVKLSGIIPPANDTGSQTAIECALSLAQEYAERLACAVAGLDFERAYAARLHLLRALDLAMFTSAKLPEPERVDAAARLQGVYRRVLPSLLLAPR